MADEKTGPGYTTDPYDTPGERAEGCPIGKLFPWTGPDGLWSTWREWHITEAGLWAGLRAGTLQDIPDCPPLWSDEMQYYRSAAAVANVLKCQWPSIVVAASAIATKIFGLW